MRRNFPRMSKPTQHNSGPLLTDHIGLRDIDLELELLKRKREMIEIQQQQLVNDHQRHYNESPHSYQGHQQHYSSNQNYSGSYGQSSLPSLMGNHYNGGGLLGKRPGDSKWNANPSPKRFSGSQGGSKKKSSAAPNRRSEPFDRPSPLIKQTPSPWSQNFQSNTNNSQIQPWNQLPFYMGSNSASPSQRFNSTKAKPVNRDFRPTKVSKSKAATSNLANKLVSYPIPIPKPKEAAPKLVKKVEDPLSDFILHAGKVPSQQVAGRLELGLGSILKDIKGKYKDDDRYKASFLMPSFMREVKHAIRERLRTVMIGKHVGKVGNIVEEYRNVFPPESDSEIINVALKAPKTSNAKMVPINFDETDSPENYFKANMDRIISGALDSLFDKLYDMHAGDHPEELKKAMCEIVIRTHRNNTDVEEKNLEKKTEQNIAKSEQEIAESEQKIAESEQGIAESDHKIAESEPKFSESEQDIAESEHKIAESVQEIEKSEPNVANDKKPETREGESNDMDTSNEPLTEVAPKVESVLIIEDLNKSNASTVETNMTNEYQLKERLKKMEYVIGSLVKRRLSIILPKYKRLLSRILNSDAEYTEAKESILAKLQDKLSIETRMEAAKLRDAGNKEHTSADSANAVPKTPSASTPKASTPAKAARILPYYVKITGRPGLPKRKQMQTFLQQFKPKSIKKHKNMPLLFVGFDNQEDFDRMLAVKESTIGNTTIIIKVSEKTGNENQNESLNVSTISGDDDVQLVKANSSVTSGDLINSDLDDQINDLLSSIRKEEEKTQDEPQNSAIDKTQTQDVATTDDLKDKTNNDKTDDVVPSEPAEIENGQSAVATNGNEKTVKAEDKNVPMEDKTTPAEDKNGEAAIKEMETEPSEKTDEEADRVAALKSEEKESGRATPTRSSARLATTTPGTIRTRRASRLAQN